MKRPALFDVTPPHAAVPRRDRRRSWCDRMRTAFGHAAASTVAWLLVAQTALAQPAPPRAAEPLAPPQAAAIDPTDLGYALGYRIGARIRADHAALEIPIDNAALARGLADAVQEAASRLDEPRLRAALAAFEEAMQRRQEAFFKRMAEAAKQNLAKGREYLAANGRRPGVMTLPSGLQYEVLRAGTGAQPGPDDIVIAHYRGTHIDGREFDGTDPEGDPAAFPLRGVVPGWQEALARMAAGAKWRIHLPPDLAYGEDGSPPAIEPNEVLVFEIELIRSERPQR
jgi:FKBP-type peptidyl-prolyl cis-trans isomerase FklB